MEEDIKILEEFLSKTDVDYAEYFNCTKSLIPDTVEIAIKNILSSYKQLEEENKKLNRKLKIKTGDIEYLQNKINKHFISDVEIKAKIKELENLKTQLPVEHMKQAQIRILKELLREE